MKRLAMLTVMTCATCMGVHPARADMTSMWTWMPKAEAPAQNPEDSEEAPRAAVTTTTTVTTTRTVSSARPMPNDDALPGVEPAAGKRQVQRQDMKDFNN